MYILVNENDVIVGSAMNKPSIVECSKNKQRVFHLPDSEYEPEIIGSKLVSYDSVDIEKD